MRTESSLRFSVLAYSRKLGNFLSFSVHRFILLKINHLINPLLFGWRIFLLYCLKNDGFCIAFAEWLDAIIEIMAELTKETIMMTANGLFSKDGVREVSIDDICRKLCISKKTFYQYYAQKEDLVADVVAYNVERKKDEFERMVEGKNAVQVLKAMFALVGRKKTMDKDKRMVKDIMKYYPETFIKRAEDRSKALHNFFVDCFDTGRKEGLIRSDMDVEGVQLLIYIMHEGMAEYLDGGHRIEGKKVSFKSLSAAFEDIVTRVLLTPKGFEEYSSMDNCKNS